MTCRNRFERTVIDVVVVVTDGDTRDGYCPRVRVAWKTFRNSRHGSIVARRDRVRSTYGSVT